MSFNEKKYQIVRNLIDEQATGISKNVSNLMEYSFYQINPPTPINPYPYHDDMCFESFSWYGGFYTDGLLIYCKDIISNIVNKDLVESYSYKRIYYHGCEMLPHTDRESCEYSASICISKDDIDWPLYIELEDKTIVSVHLNEGDAVIYKGTLLTHWREPFQGKKQIQYFLHYIDKNNIYYPEYMFDKRKVLGVKPNEKK